MIFNLFLSGTGGKAKEGEAAAGGTPSAASN
jgi:hypothetical protein